MKSKRFVELEWYDAEGDPAWTTNGDVHKTELPVVTMRGYLVRNTSKIITLAMGYHGESWVNIFNIPKGMVRGRIKTVK